MNLVFVLLLLSLNFSTGATQKQHKYNFNFTQNDYQLKFEHIDVVSYDKDYVTTIKIHTFKYNRTLAVVNATFSFRIDLMDEPELIIQSYKFMSNEYRYFPMRFEVNACNAIKANMGGIQQTFKCGNFRGCPYLKETTYYVCNWYPDQSKFPPFMPSGSYMIEVGLVYRSKEIALFRNFAVVSRPEV